MERTLSLLIVDDDEVDRAAVRRALQRTATAHDVVEAGDGEAALAALQSRVFDCALFDLRMPRENGIELLQRIRAAGHRLPVIMLTGFGDEETAVESMKAGAFDYIAKAQLSAERLDNSIRHAVRLHQADERARRAQRELERHAAQLREVAAAAAELSAPMSEQELQLRLTRLAAAILGVHAAATWLRGQPSSRHSPRDCLVTLDAAGRPQRRDDLLPLAIDDALWSSAVRKSIADTAREPALAERARRLGLDAPLVGWLAVPLFSPERRLIGVVQVTHKRQDDFDDSDEYILTQLAQLAATGIANARLLQRNQEATKLRDDMMAVVSHDLRNPLAAVLMGTALLLKTVSASDTRSRNNVERIDRAAQQMRALIDDLLDVTRIEGGQLKIDPGPVDAAALVEDALDPLRALATTKQLALDVQLPEQLPPLTGDSGRLRQVFSNLVGNAIKFTPAGGRVTVTGEVAGDAMAFCVIDTGAGIPTEHLPHIFERYWQAPDTARLGAGLGLFIVKGIVDAHGGRIDVESRLGTGSCFRFTVPLVAASAPAA